MNPPVIEYARADLARDPRRVMPVSPVVLLSLVIPGLSSLLLRGRRRLWLIVFLNLTVGAVTLGGMWSEPLFVWRWDDMRQFEQQYFDPDPLTSEQYRDRAEIVWWSAFVIVHLWSLYLAIRDRRRLLATGERQAAPVAVWMPMFWVAVLAALGGMSVGFWATGYGLSGRPNPWPRRMALGSFVIPAGLLCAAMWDMLKWAIGRKALIS